MTWRKCERNFFSALHPAKRGEDTFRQDTAATAKSTPHQEPLHIKV